MEYLTVKEVAELKGCSVRYIRKCISDGKISAVSEECASNNCLQYKVPISALPTELKERYYSGSGLRVEVVPDKSELFPAVVAPAMPTAAVSPAPPAVKLPKVVKLKRGIETFTADEREVIAFWCDILRDWRVKRTGYENLEEGDMVYIAETKRIRKEFLAEHKIVLSRDIMYRKYKAFKEEDWERLCEARGGCNKGYSSIPKELSKVFCDLYLCDRQIPISSCYRLTKEWAMENRPEMAADMPSEQTFRRYVKTLPEVVVKFFRKGEKVCMDECMPYIIRLYDEIEANDVWVADNHTLDFMSRTADGEKLHRLHITAILDAKTGVLVGWNITENPCSESTVLALRHAIMRCGIPKCFYVDNGREFLTHDIGGKGHRRRKSQEGVTNPITILDRLGIEMINALVCNGRAKPIERMFLTLKNTISRIVATFTGGNIIERPESLRWQLKNGYVPFDKEVRDMLDVLLEGYNGSPYGGCEGQFKGLSRAEAWCKSIKRRVFKTCSEGELDLLLMRTSRYQTVRENGVYINISGEKLWYNSGEDNWKFVGLKVYVRYDPADLESVRIYDDEDRFIAEWCLDTSVFVNYITTNTDDIADRQRLIAHQLRALKAMGKELTGEMRIDALALACAEAHRKTGNVKLAPSAEVKVEQLTVSEAERMPMAANGSEEIDWDRIAENAMKRRGINEEE